MLPPRLSVLLLHFLSLKTTRVRCYYCRQDLKLHLRLVVSVSWQVTSEKHKHLSARLQLLFFSLSVSYFIYLFLQCKVDVSTHTEIPVVSVHD